MFFNVLNKWKWARQTFKIRFLCVPCLPEIAITLRVQKGNKMALQELKLRFNVARLTLVLRWAAYL